MSESVEILIKADDQASAKLVAVEKNLGKTGNAVKDFGGKAKATTEFAGAIAAMTGNSQVAGFAAQFAGLTERVGQFSEVAKAGKAGALAFKLGLIGLAAGIGATVGKAIGDVVFETAKFERAMKRAQEASAELDAQLSKSRSTMFSGQTQQIELIRDPEAKKAAYSDLLETIDKNMAGVTERVRQSEAEVEKWAAAWKITGDDTEFARQAEEELKLNKEQLNVLREQRAEIQGIVSERASQVDRIQRENEAVKKSSEFVQKLRDEIKYLNATREEQIAIEAKANTTRIDRSEAELLLQERDAILSKNEAVKEFEATQKRTHEEQERAAKKLIEDAEREKQRVDDIVESEKQRLELRRIELERGHEAAQVQGLINKGLEETVAKQIAAEESALNKLQAEKDSQKKAQEEFEKDKEAQLTKNAKEAGKVEKQADTPTLQASESRLLSRGPGWNVQTEVQKIGTNIALLATYNAKLLDAAWGSNKHLEKVAANTKGKTNLVPVS